MEALNKIKMKPDIILLDINMPRMDGIEVCRLIRSKVWKMKAKSMKV